jgi:thiaminase
VARHAGGRFAEGVEWLRAEIDARSPALDAARQGRLHELFVQSLAAEIPFHTAAYD